MCCILPERKFCPLFGSGIRIFSAITVLAASRILPTPLFDPKIPYLGHSLPSYGSWNEIYLTDSWRIYISRPSAQFVAWLGHVWQFHSDFSPKKWHLFPKKPKFRPLWRHRGSKYEQWKFLTKTFKITFYQGSFSKKNHLHSVFRSREEEARSPAGVVKMQFY